MKPKKVLVVEDEMIIALLIEKMVQNLGHQVVDKVTSGEAAVSAASEKDPDIILMDIRLQGEMDGIEAMLKIREKRNIPVIYISGNTDMIYQDKIKKTDYIDFLSKPITISDLNRSFDLAS
ncbi:MAG: response regulator [Balneolaceae bacterium]|jgi:CheY-like chemotaxis protein